MRQAGLPVLPHQAATQAVADRALDRQTPRLRAGPRCSADPGATAGAGCRTDAGLAALIEAGRVARLEHEKLEERAREAVRAWAELEQAYDAQAEKYDHLAQRTLGGQMERFAKELKRNPQLDSVLRQRGVQLGIAEGRCWRGWCRARRSSRS